MTSVKKCRPWSDTASETRRLVWVYTFCICPKVPFCMTLAKFFLRNTIPVKQSSLNQGQLFSTHVYPWLNELGLQWFYHGLNMDEHAWYDASVTYIVWQWTHLVYTDWPWMKHGWTCMVYCHGDSYSLIANHGHPWLSMLLCVSCPSAIEFSGILFSLLARSIFNSPQSLEGFRRTLAHNFIQIRQRVKNFPIDPHCKNCPLPATL